MSHSTGYADVDAILAELLAGVGGTLGPQLVGVISTVRWQSAIFRSTAAISTFS